MMTRRTVVDPAAFLWLIFTSICLYFNEVLYSIRKTGKRTKGANAFFSKEDAIKAIAKAKIKAIIQPGGSVADEKIIKEANKAKIAMVFTGIRHFKR